MPTGVRMPVVSMSMRFLIGMVQALVTPGMLQALRSSRRPARPCEMRSGETGGRRGFSPRRAPSREYQRGRRAPLGLAA